MTRDEWKRFCGAEDTKDLFDKVERELIDAITAAPGWMPGRLAAAQAELKAFYRIRRRLETATVRKPQ